MREQTPSEVWALGLRPAHPWGQMPEAMLCREAVSGPVQDSSMLHRGPTRALTRLQEAPWEVY